MSPSKKVFYRFCSALPVDMLLNLSGVEVLLPYHHVVSDEELPHIRELYAYSNTKKFRADLDWLLSRFQPIHPDTLAATILDGRPLPKKTFLLSFDDGFREVHDVIAPILLEKGVPALFFINPSFIDNNNLFYRCKLSLVLHRLKMDPVLTRAVAENLECTHTDYGNLRNTVLKINYVNRHKADELGRIAAIDFQNFLQQHRPFLTSGEVTKLHDQGFVFGGHSIDHPDYPSLTTAEQQEQTRISTEMAMRLGKERFGYFAFPHDDREVRQKFFSVPDPARWPQLYFGVQNQREEKQNRVFHRFNAEGPAEDIRGKARAVLLYNAFLRLFNRQKIERK